MTFPRDTRYYDVSFVTKLFVQFATTMGHYYGRKGEVLGQILVNICLQAANVASIIIAAQVMDDFMIFLFGHTYGVHFIPPYVTSQLLI